MKLGALNSAIRAADKVWFDARIYSDLDLSIQLVVQKTPLLAELAKAFPQGRSHETGLHLDEIGHFRREGDRQMALAAAAAAADDDDRIGEGSADEDLIG